MIWCSINFSAYLPFLVPFSLQSRRLPCWSSDMPGIVLLQSWLLPLLRSLHITFFPQTAPRLTSLSFQFFTQMPQSQEVFSGLKFKTLTISFHQRCYLPCFILYYSVCLKSVFFPPERELSEGKAFCLVQALGTQNNAWHITGAQYILLANE